MNMGNNKRGSFIGVKMMFIVGVLMVQQVCGVEFEVGGSKGVWAVPSDPNAQTLNQWAESRRFQIGDSIGNYHNYISVCLFYFEKKKLYIFVLRF